MTPHDLTALLKVLDALVEGLAGQQPMSDESWRNSYHEVRSKLAALAETPPPTERYAEVSRHELRGPRADRFLAHVFRRFEMAHPPPLGDGGNLIMLWRRDFAPPPAVAPAALVALVQEYQSAGNAYGSAETPAEHDAAQKRMQRARSLLMWWPRHPSEDMPRWHEWYPPTPDAAAPPVAAPAVEDDAQAWANFLAKWVDYNCGKHTSETAWAEFQEQQATAAPPPAPGSAPAARPAVEPMPEIQVGDVVFYTARGVVVTVKPTLHVESEEAETPSRADLREIERDGWSIWRREG